VEIHVGWYRVGMIDIENSRKRVLEIFKVNEPFGYVALTEDLETHELQYTVFEPTLTEEEARILQQIKSLLIEQIDVTLADLGGEKEAEEYLKKMVEKVIKDFRIKLNDYSLEKIMYYIIRDFVGYGKIDVMMRDPLIEDISCNGVNIPIYVWHREYESLPTNVSFSSEEELNSFIIRLAYKAGKMISIANPILDAVLPDGSRIQLTYGREVTKHGSTFDIRKFRADPYTIIDLINFRTLSSMMAAFLWYLIENKCNIFVCGPTASGKTTTLNCLANFIHPNYKIVTIEDTPEIMLYHENWIRSVARPAVTASAEISLFDLLKVALRQRPDYIIVGEVRGAEAYTLFQAISVGHGGISTLHADSVAAAIRRLESEPMNVPRSLIANLDVILVLRRFQIERKPARRVITVTEIVGLDPRNKEIITNEVFRYRFEDDSHAFLGRSYHLERIAEGLGKSLKDVMNEVDKRRIILEWMTRNNMRSFREVSEVIRKFYRNPEEIFKIARVGA